MLKCLLCVLIAMISLSTWAQVEDPSDRLPTNRVAVQPDADTRGMANPPLRSPVPAPPAYSPTYVPGNDNSPPPVAAPAPGAPVDPLLTLFDQGRKGMLGSCTIEAVNDPRTGCQFEVRVRGQVYPSHFPGMCSSDDMASRLGCNYGDQQKNVACILRQASLVGFCR